MKHEQKIAFCKFDTLAQYNHFLLGLVVIVTAALFEASSTIYVAIGFTFYAAIKEFWYDQNFETKLERGSNLKDFLFYCLGIFLGLGLVFIKYQLALRHV